MSNFILSCESTVDLPFAYVNGRDIPVVFYSYSVDGVPYTDDMLRDPQALPRFYQFLEEGKFPSTSQINEFTYLDFFEEQLQKGDLLHVVLSSGLTGSIQNAERAAAKLRPKYPDRKLIVVDSLCGSSGYGLLIDDAADMRDRGCTIDELKDWLLTNRHLVHHMFYTTELTYFRRSGRVSGPIAVIGSILNICPIMHVNDAGKIVVCGKVRGKKSALRTILDAMEAHAQGGANYSGKCFICHSQRPDEAANAKEAIAERFPKCKRENIRIFDIGTIIGSHCGPGSVAFFFMGDKRAPAQ